MEQLRLSLLENGIDFIREGIQTFFMTDDPRPEAHKYAVMHLWSGTLLILKERLRREHPSLVWKDVTEVNNVNSQTVNFDELIKRLRKCGRLELEKKHLDLLQQLQRQRNRLEHFDCELKLQETQELIGTTTEFVDAFLKNELETDLRTLLPNTVFERVCQLKAIAARLREEWRQRASVYDNLPDHTLEELARVEPYDPKHNPDPVELLECPQCQQRSVACATDHSDVGICTDLDCRAVLHLQPCECCGATSVEWHLCESCQANYDRQMSKDD